jgi:SNF2 family DNA or RNA helicase
MRIVLHAGIIDNTFRLWGEPETTRSRTTRTFGLDARAARTWIARVVEAPEHRGIALENVAAWLPTRGSAPMSSTVPPSAHPRTARPATIDAWTIRAATLRAPTFVELLSRCAGRRLLDEDVAIGSDIAYWSHVLRFAAEVVVAQDVLPAITSDGSGNAYRAIWRPILGQGQLRRAAQIAAAMPPVCRALTPAVDQRPELSAKRAFDAALETFVDHLMRSNAAPTPAAQSERSLHARWLTALRAPDSALPGTPAELRDFAAQIEAWQRPVLDDRASAYRLCLRVEEPVAEDDVWRVTYLLQSHADLSLLVDAEGAAHSPLLRRELLAALGKAATFSAEVDRSLHTGESLASGFTLDTQALYAFLTTRVGLFEAAGIGVILPSWWLGMDTKARIALRGRVASKKGLTSGMLGKLSMLAVDWKVALGDEMLSFAELERIAKLKTPLVRIRGRWVHVDAAEIRRALERLKRGTRQVSVGDAVRLQAGGAVGELPAGTIIEADGVVDDFMKRIRGEATLTAIAPPADLLAELRPYQQRGLNWLHFLTHTGFGACLADDMGLGKTIQTLALILHDWNAEDRAPVLLVCPTSVIGNWSREAERFAPSLPVVVHHGSDRERGAAFARRARTQAIVLTSYALLQRDLALLQKTTWRGIVLDEAQNIKNADSKGAAAAREIEAGYRLALTGTPVENHVGDLWSIMQFLNPGMLDSAAAFKRDFFIPIQALGEADAVERLRRLTGPFVLRRLKSDKTIIADLPAKDEHNVFCNLTREQASLYAAVLRDMDAKIDETTGIKRRGFILASLSKLKQICNHPAQFAGDNSALAGRSGKLARLEEMLEEVLESGERALVFTQFAKMGTLITRRLAQRFGIDVIFLHGAVTKRARDEMIERFTSDRGPAVFVLSLKAGGSGLNLTRASHVFHFDRWWNPAVENQATDRAYRIGQRKTVQVHKFICAGTLEEKIDTLIERKRSVSERVVGAGEGWLTELSSAQLRDLVALGADAVAD